MSTLKKILALTLALAMVMSLGVFAAFKDQATIDEDCTDAMELMNALGVILGDNNGNANPTKTITRAEAATMIFRLMNKGKDDASIYNGMKIFTDVPSGSWFEGYVNYAYTMGIVQGRTATTFDPYAPVTGLEIAKMLLTCCGYNADKQGYTGANWAKNVQNDAFSAEMLDNYGMALSVPAQRQWVAVMFEDALNCQMVKYLLGELTEYGEDYTLGEKKFDYTTATGVVNAIGTAALPGTTGTAKYTTVGATQYKKLVDSSLLGQEVKVYFKSATSVYAIIPTSDNSVGEAKVCDVTSTTANSVTKYTVGNLTGALDSHAIVAINNDSCKLVDATSQLSKLGGNSTALVKAIDNDDDGDIDVMLVTSSLYGEIGITSKGVVSAFSKTFDADEVEDNINYINTVEDGDFVKATANIFTGLYDIEALTAKTGVLNSKVSDVYTLSGTKYEASADNNSDVTTYFSGAGLTQDVTFYTDGQFIVYAENTAETVTTMPTNLVLLIGKTTSTDAWENDTLLVKVLGLDGKVAQYTFGGSSTAFANLKNDRIYQYTIDEDDGTITLKVPSLPSNVSNSVEITAGVYTGTLTADQALSSTRDTLGNAPVSSDAKLFVKYVSDETDKYTVMTISDFTAGQSGTSTQTFTKSVKGITTVLGGFVNLTGEIVEGTTSVGKYVLATADSYEYSDGTYYYTYAPVKYLDGTTETLILAKAKESVGAGDIDKNKIYELNNVSAAGIASLSAEKFATATDGTGLNTVTGANATLVQITGTGLVTLDNDCVVVVKTLNKDGTTKSVAVGGDVAALYAATGSGETYSAIKAAALEDVDGGTSFTTKDVAILYVQVQLAD